MYTEEEAQKKQCRIPINIIVGIHGAISESAQIFGKCSASDCMAWRWNPTRKDIEEGLNFTKGYCGLGGRP